MGRGGSGEDGAEDGGALSPTASIAGSVSGSFAAGRSTSKGGADRSKMVVLVRDDLLPRWGTGKLAVMVASAVLGLYKRVYKNRDLRATLVTWEGQKASKVCLRCPDEAALARITEAARAAGIPAHSLLESVAGASQDEAPSRTRALVALGPAPLSALSAVGCQALPSL